MAAFLRLFAKMVTAYPSPIACDCYAIQSPPNTNLATKINNEANLFAATAATLNLWRIVPNFILAHHEKNAEFRELIHFLTGTGTANRNIAEPTSIERSEAKRLLKL